MADNRVSQLNEATSAGTADVFLIVQGGASKRITKANIFKSLESLDVVGQVLDKKTFESLSNSGAISTTLHTTFLSNNAAMSTLAMTLAAGVSGMTKVISCSANLGTITLTVTNGSGFSTITFSAAVSAVTLHYVNAHWVVIGSNNVVIA